MTRSLWVQRDANGKAIPKSSGQFVPAAPTVAPALTLWATMDPPVRLKIQPVGVAVVEIDAGKALIQVAPTTGVAHLTATGYVVVEGRRTRAVRTGKVSARDLPLGVINDFASKIALAQDAVDWVLRTT